MKKKEQNKKKSHNPKNIPEWRLFEQLVQRMEQALAPKGAIVKSPDKIIDKETGELREVDASIRYESESGEILITVECRYRGHNEDVPWIEQLITKKSKLGAQKTIAVSSKGFSSAAIKTAVLHGIELRRIQDITTEEILNNFKKIDFEIEYINYRIKPGSFKVEFDIKNSTISFSDKINKALMSKEHELNTELLFEDSSDRAFTLNDIINDFYLRDNVGARLNEIGKTITIEHHISFPEARYYTHSNLGKVGVIFFHMGIEWTLLKFKIRPDFRQVHEYHDLNKPLIQLSSAIIIDGPTKLMVAISRDENEQKS